MTNFDFSHDDKVKDECGVFGVFDNDDHLDVARVTYYGLFALQHRGQESCGIAVNDNGTIIFHKDMGLLPEVFNESILNHLNGQIAVGHVRYSTTGSSNPINAQPLVSKYIKGTLTIAHNGNITNAAKLRLENELNGMIFQTSNDSEVIASVIAKERLSCASVEEAIRKMMEKVMGAYSLVIMSPSKLIAVRDKNGIRPLSLGKLKNSYVIASETAAFDAIGATFIRDIEPGEIVVIDKTGVKSLKGDATNTSKVCIFEYVYFARPDSIIEGSSVYEARKMAGKYLAIEHPVEADVVIGVPDSGITAALGYSEQSGIPYGYGLIKNRYIGRTFIQPTQILRENSVRIKLNAVNSVVKDKRVIMVDDSIVRGTTSKRIVNLLREAGAKEVHMRVSSPPFLNVCHFGTDISSKDVLVAVKHSIDEIKDIIGLDSLGYLSVENLEKIPVGAKCKFCMGCFTGLYPEEIPENPDKFILEKGTDFIKDLSGGLYE